MKQDSRLVRAQKEAFGELVNDGTYGEQFSHPPASQDLFTRAIARAVELLDLPQSAGIDVLDSGCGNGAWLEFLCQLPIATRLGSLNGFDITPEMVVAAGERLAGCGLPLNLSEGNALDRKAFGSPGQSYQLVYTYDVIQQLPRKQQLAGCELLLQVLAPGGVAIIFDNDADTPFGRRMGRRKFFTRYFGLPLVPRYYCNAHYPRLARIAQTLGEAGYEYETVVASNGAKRALLLWRPGNQGSDATTSSM